MMSANETLIGKHIWPEVVTSDRRVGDGLNDRPPLRVKQNALAQPVADELLAGFQLAAGLGQDGAKAVSKGSLVSTGNLDGPPQRGNVCSLHEYRNNTNRFVISTNPFVRQEDKGVCTVIDMASRSIALKRPPVAAPKPPKKKRKALPGVDGKTLGQRVQEAMAYKSGRLGQEYRAADLLREVAKLSPPGDTILTQQMLSAILRNTVTQTSKTPFIAMACGVNAVWMSHGIGKMTD
jgi:hypothetical protein